MQNTVPSTKANRKLKIKKNGRLLYNVVKIKSPFWLPAQVPLLTSQTLHYMNYITTCKFRISVMIFIVHKHKRAASDTLCTTRHVREHVNVVPLPGLRRQYG